MTLTRSILALSAVLAACSGDGEQVWLDPFPPGITYSPMFSAFGGSQVYALAPIMLAADPTSRDSDPVLASTLMWQIDEKFARLEPFESLPEAIQITTRAVGFTDLAVHGKYRSGRAFKTQARLTIRVASDEDWARGQARYYSGSRPSLATLLASIEAHDFDAGASDSDARPILSQDSACASCHDETNTLDSVMHTPMQTAGYSDDQLIAIFTRGQKPAGGTFNSALLRDRPRPDSIFARFHAWSVNEEDQVGLVLKLRSLAPQVTKPLDLQRLREEAD